MIKNQSTAKYILDMMNTGIECAEHLYVLPGEQNYNVYEALSGNLSYII